MQKWEYMTILVSGFDLVVKVNEKNVNQKLFDLLTKIGEEGWEVVGLSERLIIAKRAMA